MNRKQARELVRELVGEKVRSYEDTFFGFSDQTKSYGRSISNLEAAFAINRHRGSEREEDTGFIIKVTYDIGLLSVEDVRSGNPAQAHWLMQKLPAQSVAYLKENFGQTREFIGAIPHSQEGLRVRIGKNPTTSVRYWAGEGYTLPRGAEVPKVKRDSYVEVVHNDVRRGIREYLEAMLPDLSRPENSSLRKRLVENGFIEDLAEARE